MQLLFQGANRSVTGSRHILKINNKQILMDCGLFQGKRGKQIEYNRYLSFNPQKIDAVILSHAHIDHCGNLPNLVKNGFNGAIYATHATADLCAYMLQDSAYIQEKDVLYLNEKRTKEGLPLLEPIYSQEDVQNTLLRFKPISYNTGFEVLPDVKGCLYEAGHILGSSITLLTVHDKEKNTMRKIAYTGDLGRNNLPLLRDPYQVPEADYLIIESTYGNRFHEAIGDVEKKLEAIFTRTCQKGGKLIIPAFALGRTQEVIYTMNKLYQEKRIPDVPIYVDSPLAVNISEVFKRHTECFDREVRMLFLDKRKDPLGFKRLNYIATVEDSKKLNEHQGPCVIISASGMCEFGRILHHLKNSLEDDRNTILIVGYMAENTLGRRLIEKYPSVPIFGKPYRVRAHIEVIDAFSAHADRNDLLNFIQGVSGLRKIFLVHGEEKQLLALRQGLIDHGMKEETIIVPRFGEEVELP